MAKKKKSKKIKKQKKKVRTRKKKKVVKQKKQKIIHPVIKKEEQIKRTRIRVIGIGGGAGSIVSEIVSRIKKVDFVAANTDSRALKIIKKAKKFQFGQNLTKGLGTGMNPEIGEMASQNEKERIKQLFEGQDLCIIIACLGGGTGSGATPLFAKSSRESGCLTYGIFTLPFEFEGEKKMEIARNSLLKIKPHLNAFSVIPNERIFQIIDKNTPLTDALSAVNKRLAKNLEGLIEMIYLPGLINIDFADLRTILSGRGRLAYLSTVEIEESNKEEASKRVISSQLYPYTIKGARNILYNIVGGRSLQLSEVSKISKTISESVNKNARIIFGISQNSKYLNKIKITLLATGCGQKGILLSPIQLLKPKPRPKPRPKLHPPKFSKKILEGKPKPKPKPKPRPRPKPHPPKPLPRPEPSKPVEVRRNALQVRKVIEEEEKEILEKEKAWETPAILRRKNNE